MATATVRPGDVVDLLVCFGSQTRLKCASCTKYMRPATTMEDRLQCKCGVTYLNSGPRTWIVERTP